MISKVSDAGGISISNYVYDGYNRLSEFYSQNTEAQYSYNPEGLRESKTVNGNTTRFLYSDENIIGEFTGDDYYIYHRGTELIGYTSFSGKNLTYQQNSHGNVTALLDYDGTELKTYSYNAYGKEEAFIPNPEGNQTILYQWKNETDSTYNPFRYCGEYVDAETGLVYLRNRYYDPSVGRFITEDPAKDGLNWYVYCGNNPVNYIDPLGLEHSFKKAYQYEISFSETLKLRETAEMLGGTVTFDSKTKTATVSFGDMQKASFVVGKDGTKINSSGVMEVEGDLFKRKLKIDKAFYQSVRDKDVYITQFKNKDICISYNKNIIESIRAAGKINKISSLNVDNSDKHIYKKINIDQSFDLAFSDMMDQMGPKFSLAYTVFSTWIQNRGLDNIDDADTKLEINISQNLLIKGYMIFLTANGNNITHVGTLLK